ncbi:hypothetical protein ACQ3I4_08335 [Zafaria sp. Z1313]|uniref:hypothetical protein n=1 Tax=unclassified Zafaria TaxID=2828765 RepID=UPI002E761EDB|nr:hypothetical protein [Zafaria sp. J156]MEE1620989.1 hypothetical protein [Zafaria sp. J156]
MRRPSARTATSRAGAALIAAALLLAGCAAPGTQPPSSTAPPSPTAEPGSSSGTGPDAGPDATEPAAGTEADAVVPRASAPSPATAALTVYYVALDDRGIAGRRIGCGDSLVAAATEPVRFTDQLEASLERLLDAGTPPRDAGLVNALARSELRFVSATVDGDSVTVMLTGRLVSAGTCDAPRLREQLEETARFAAGVGEAVVLVDGTPIGRLLDASG